MNALPYPALMAPFELAGRRLRNRLVHPSMTTLMAEQARVTSPMVQYFENRARGGAAMLVTEPLSMARHHHLASRADAWNDTDLDGLKRLAAAVESHDCRILGQLLERGRARNQPGRSYDGIGASALPDDLSWSMPRVLTTAEIRALIEEYVQSAERLAHCGFSGLEISAGHGHFFHQVLSPRANARDDAYGGDLEGRTRLLRELVTGLRSACGPHFIVGLKLPGNDWIPGSIEPDHAAAIARRLTSSREVDYVCFAWGSHSRSLERHVPDGHTPRVPYRDLIRQLRMAIPDTPVIGLGRITDPAEADALIAKGTADLVAVGRALVADPAWYDKAVAGRAHDIRYCVSCNTCWERISLQRLPLGCDNNPRVGRADEVDFRPAHAPARKRIVVVGAGPAGMEAAWVAAQRGHAVTLFGRSVEVGGKLRLRARLPGGEGLSSVYDYQHAAALRARVDLRLGVEATTNDIAVLSPDEVVMATGADMVPPLWLPAQVHALGWVPDLRRAMAGALRHSARQAGTAVLFDMDHSEGTYAAAEHLCRLFARVVVLTPRDTIGQDLPVVVRQGVLRRFAEQRIEVVREVEVVWSDAIELEARLDYTCVHTGRMGRIDDLAWLAWSTPRTPNDRLVQPLRDLGIAVRIVGDARVARSLHAATFEGHQAGCEI
jgi:2,4-dienoyl-CoA reductase-like NADH-dependent reductase (Old Yellow Enzyme family)